MVNPPNNFKTMNNEINTLNRQKGAILLLDNYDSFTYNLLHVVKEQGVTDIEVFRNDEIRSSSRRDRAYRKKPDCYCPSSGNMRQPKVSWEFVWAIRPSAKHSEPHSKI